MEPLLEFAGRLHPMLVHLPIGILLIGIVLLVLSEWEKMEVPHGVLNIILGVGALMAVASCVSGYLLSTSGDYDPAAVDLHQWMAIFFTLISLGAWYLHYEYWLRDRVLHVVAGVVFVSLVATGHMGASLTHGSDYLTEPFEESAMEFDVTSVNLNEAVYYRDLIAPILERKCVSCHGAEKQKGKLRLDTHESILRGGKSGAAVVVGSAGDSELWERILLPLEEDDHMPPKEKGQLNETEKTLIKLWINTGANADKKVSELVSDADLKILAGGVEQNESSWPKEDIAPADAAAIQALQQESVSVTPVAVGSHYLSVNFVSLPKDASRVLPILNEVSKHVVWLKLTGCELTPDDFRVLATLSNLGKLSLDDTNTTDADVEKLIGLPSLSYLNLKGTLVTSVGVERLEKLVALRELFLFETKVDQNDREKLQQLLPNVHIDFGNYQVPTFQTDTTTVKPPKN